MLAMTASVLMFVIVSTTLSVALTGASLKERAREQDLPTALGEIRSEVLRQIAAPVALTRSLATNEYILNWEEQGLPEQGAAAWKTYAQTLKNESHAATIAWVSEKTGKYLDENGFSRTVQRSDATDNWFYDFLSKGKQLEIKLGKDKASSVYNLFIDARFDVNGKIGVAALGLSVNELADFIRKQKIGNSGFVYLVSPDGAFVIHRDAALADGQHFLRDTSGFNQEMVTKLLMGQRFSSVSYSATDGERIAAASYVPELNLYIVAEVPQAEILGKITQTSTISALLAALVGGGIGLLIIAFVSKSIAGPIKRAAEMLREIADGHGDLTRRMKVETSDEVGMLAQSFNRFIDSLNRLIGDVRVSTVTISSASREIAVGNLDLSVRTEAQASSLEETAAAMEELTSTVQQNANNAREANRLAFVAADRARQGGEVVSDVVSTMGTITESSQKIVNIISVIDSIAFQTNILALNAAVEAARAGDQGRGFAVVASEVRSLAQRSASAAKEIKTLIDSSSKSVEAGRQQVANAQVSMSELVAAVEGVSEIITDIANASSEQSDGIGQINLAIMQIDSNTQQNAAQVEQAAAAAKSMEEQASSLSIIVEKFRLDERLRN
ncbi:HAMP domain-containing protein [Burkholderia vietnamiensis]|nr:HAMP domain-containing protein [Burkholderia vietnamiensis]